MLWKGEILVSAPELIIEVLSFATAKYDKTGKMDLYKSIGVKEYILVSQDGSVELYKLQNDNFKDYIKIDDLFKILLRNSSSSISIVTYLVISLLISIITSQHLDFILSSTKLNATDL